MHHRLYATATAQLHLGVDWPPPKYTSPRQLESTMHVQSLRRLRPERIATSSDGGLPAITKALIGHSADERLFISHSSSPEISQHSVASTLTRPHSRPATQPGEDFSTASASLHHL